MQELSREEKVSVMKLLLERMVGREAAEFVVDLQDAVDGLQRNNTAYIKEFRKLYHKG